MDQIEPPSNPDEWSDEQWIEWLNATDEDSLVANGPSLGALGTRVINSAAGQIVGQAMLGLAQAIYGQHEDAAIVIDGRSEPSDDDPFDVALDPHNPAASTVVFKGHPGKGPELQ